MCKGPEVRGSWVWWGNPKKFNIARGSSRGGRSEELKAGEAAATGFSVWFFSVSAL